MSYKPEIRIPWNGEIIESYLIEPQYHRADLPRMYEKCLIDELDRMGLSIDLIFALCTTPYMHVDAHNGYQFADNRTGPLLLFKLPSFMVEIVEIASSQALSSLESKILEVV